ncbi:hypothetical protein T4C_13128 [Trichinella pseudospiralis]|uniref:PiggyBac transposable element-derived protein domain-containing protein n=1 Tax=Trichinella pseudospiralis TaxID=6337 RepID=A0A0V1J7Q1_TRIPS|nr:hypothetical protein T4C_13128 [Trichinella pseudospiralis]
MIPLIAFSSKKKNPIDYFKHFISGEMISLIVEQTNLYAMQQTLNKEIEIFLGLLTPYQTKSVATAFVDRSDPSYNRWFKIRPVLDLFLARCKSVKSEEKQCIDAYSKASSHIKDAVGCGNMRQENY